MTTERCLIVLLLEASSEARAFVRHCLEQSGSLYTILEAETAAAGYQHCLQAIPDVILCSAELPDRHSLDWLKALSKQSDPPILILLGQDQPDLPDLAQQLGARESLLRADLSPALVRCVLRHAGQQRQWQRQLAHQQQVQRDLEESQLARDWAVAQLEAQTMLLARIARAEPLTTILHDLIAQIQQLLPDSLCSVLLVDDANQLQHAASLTLPEDYARTMYNIPIGEGIGSCGTAAFRKQLVITADIDTDPLWAAAKPVLLRNGIQAAWSMPILASDGRLLGTFGMFYTEVRSPQPHELEILDKAASIAGIAIEREQAETALRQSEATNRAMLAAIPDLLLRIKRDGTCLDFIPPNTIPEANFLPIQFNVSEILAPEVWRHQQERMDQASHTGQLQVWEHQVIKAGVLCDEEVRVVSCGPDEYLVIVRDITDRKRAAVELQTQQNLLQAFLDNLPHMAWFKDCQGRFVKVNLAFGRSCGLDPGDLVGKTDYDIHPPDLAWICQAADRAAMESGQQQRVEKPLRNQDGIITRWLDAINTPIYDEQGELLGTVGLGIDITERKQAELALNQSQAIQNAMIQAIPDLLIRLDRDGFYKERISGQYCRTLLPSPEIENPTIHDVLPPDLVQKRLHYVGLALETGRLQVYEQSFESDGERCYEEVRIVPILEQEVLIIVRDITDRKQAEAALRESEERRRLALDLTETGSWEFSVATGEAIWSDSHYRLMGLVPGEQDSNYPTWRDRIHPDDLAWVEQTFHYALETHSPLDVEYRVVHPDGTVRWMLTKGQGIYDETDQAVRMLGVMMDVSDRKQAELALQKLNEELEQRVQRRTQELARSEQDLRTIFNNVYNAIFIHDLDGTILDFNDRVLELHRATRTEMQGATVADISAPDAPLELISSLLQRARTGETLHFEWKNRRFDDNSTLETEVSLNSIILGNRSVLIACVRDISDRKQAERALQESERRYATLAATAPVAIFRFDTEPLNCIYANEYWSELTGRPKEAALGQGWIEALHPDDREAFLNQCAEDFAAQVAGQKFITQGEGRHLRPDGSVSWFYAQVAPEVDADGQVVGTIGTLTNITARKQMEFDLAESEIKFRQLVEGANALIWASDYNHCFTYLSPQFKSLFGWEPEEWLGRSFVELIHPDDQAKILNNAQDSIALGRESGHLEFRHRHRERGYIWVSGGATPILAPDGTLVESRGIVVDISDRKQAEQALRDSEERLRLALTAANQGLYDIDLETGNEIVSPEYAQMLGYDSTSFHETTAQWMARLHPDDRESAVAIYQAYISGELPDYRVEFRQRTQDGQWKWILSIGKLVAWDETGRPLRMIGIHTDISDRKQAEAELHQAITTNQALLNALPDLILRISRNGVYRDGIPTETLDLLLPRDQLIGKPVWEVLPPQLAQDRMLTIERAFQTGLTQIHEYQLYIDGELRYEEARCVVCQEDEAMVLVRDITDRKRAEINLQQLNQELEQRVSDRTHELQQAMEAAEAANQAKSRFLANMSHELRTPLNAILGFAQLIYRDPTLPPEKRQQIQIINRSGEHLLNLINDILEMSKIEAGRVIFTPSCLDLYALLDTLEAMFRLRASEKGLQFLIVRDPQLPQYVETDANKLRQVLINLIGNGIKFTAAGQVVVRIGHQIPPEQEHPSSSDPTEPLILQFEVADTGVGIEVTELEGLFEPFIQSRHQHPSQEGTGLGLPISRQFVRLMGGDLAVQSQLGSGSRFTFTLPVRLAAASHYAGSPERTVIGLAPDQPTYRILVVEDQETNRQLLMQLLQSLGFEVQTATNGQEAIAYWAAWRPHLIWMDMRMPVMDGYATTRWIREQEQARQPSTVRTVIIALTANAFEEDRARILATGCDDFIRKPYQEAMLLEAMATHLGVRYLYAHDVLPCNPGLAEMADFDAIAALQMLSEAQLHQLYQATIQLDSQHLATLIQAIQPEQPLLAALLTEKLTDFAFDQILLLLQEVRSGQETSL